jgi:hypothetical protein
LGFDVDDMTLGASYMKILGKGKSKLRIKRKNERSALDAGMKTQA